MDYNLIGKFISEQRKLKNLTQLKLAEKLNVSEKTISKWECGNGFPDTSLIIPLCEVLEISANELLTGKKLETKEYEPNAENNLINLIKEKQENKKGTIVANVMAFLILIPCFTLFFVASFINMQNWVRILLIVIGFIVLFAGVILVCIIDNHAGYFECRHCKHRFRPKDIEYIIGPHTLTTRLLKCPECGKKTYCKKRLTKK